MALLAYLGVDEEGFREVLAVEVGGSEKGGAYASLLRGLLERGLKGVRLLVSDAHEGIKAAISGELPGAGWQRCIVHSSLLLNIISVANVLALVSLGKTPTTLVLGFTSLNRCSSTFSSEYPYGAKRG